MRCLRLVAAVLALLALAPVARAIEVDLQLVLAVDVSRSIDPEEAQLQRQGYIEAFTHPEVQKAIRSGPLGRIAVTYFEWAGTHHQQTIAAWTVIDGKPAAEKLAAILAASPVISANWTSISAAIDYAVPLFEVNGLKGERRVIDISGDGRNNQGRSAEAARDDAVAKGIVINGLPIINERANFGRPPERDLDVYFENSVISGPGAFMVVVRSFEAFAEAIRSKLVREIAGPALPARFAAELTDERD
ncbi:MAG: DUF1194 domain-containing protein [Alphaproteobacteria bacterium]|nr:DUF1194 domain-containing protein [Alphaproteobacteria bacterium]